VNRLSINTDVTTKELLRSSSELAAISFDRARGWRDSLDLARALYRARRVRDAVFEPGLFGEPAWDILLTLYVAHLEGQRISIKCACLASAVPATTALRYIAAMTERGIVLRSRCDEDARRTFLSLSDAAAASMRDMLDKLHPLPQQRLPPDV
jgi:DNA-binding MarR family transcriptional regulator